MPKYRSLFSLSDAYYIQHFRDAPEIYPELRLRTMLSVIKEKLDNAKEIRA